MLQTSQITIVKADALKPHEKTDTGNLEKLKRDILQNGLLYPVVADKNTNTILDGHHRHRILSELNLLVPVMYVDYFRRNILVNSGNGRKITKVHVVRAAERGKLMPNKSTRHFVRKGKEVMHISSALPRVSIRPDELFHVLGWKKSIKAFNFRNGGGNEIF